MDDLNKLKVADLKTELKKRGLAVGGVKAVLVERLQEAIDQEGKESEPQVSKDAPKGQVEEMVDVEEVVPSVTIEEPIVVIAGESRVREVDDTKRETPPGQIISFQKDSPTPSKSSSKSPVKEQVMDQPQITEIIPTETKPPTIPIHQTSLTTEKLPSVAVSESAQKTPEETVQSNNDDTRKRKRDQPATTIEEPPSSPIKRMKPSRPRSLTPEPSPHRITEATKTPSIHPPTKAIYITCLSRPLSIPAFTNHITSLTISKQSPKQLWLDGIKSHGYVVFNDEEDASSVRNALNGNSWPPNEKRKELSVDFITVDSVQEFIDREESNRSQRFEIIYVKRDGKVTPLHRISESRESHPVKLIDDVPARKPPTPEPTIPTGPRASRRDDVSSRQRVEVRGGEKVRVVQPDELFRKTTTKPWIYWAEVSQDVIDRRRR